MTVDKVYAATSSGHHMTVLKVTLQVIDYHLAMMNNNMEWPLKKVNCKPEGNRKKVTTEILLCLTKSV
jgi:hypothetical protein